MTTHSFDDCGICWHRIGDLENLLCSVLAVDESARTVDVLFKFPPNRKTVLHRHRSLTHLFVLQGEHRIYEADGRVKDARPVGRYTISPAGPGSHREGGGDGQDAVVVMSFRGSDGAIIELLDEEENTLDTLTLQGWAEMYRAQRVAEPARAA